MRRSLELEGLKLLEGWSSMKYWVSLANSLAWKIHFSGVEVGYFIFFILKSVGSLFAILFFDQMPGSIFPSLQGSKSSISKSGKLLKRNHSDFFPRSRIDIRPNSCHSGNRRNRSSSKYATAAAGTAAPAAAQHSKLKKVSPLCI